MPEQDKLNPQVADFEIGIRSLRKIKIYPLSLGSQIEMSEMISQAITKFFTEHGSDDDIAVVGFIVELVRDNLPKFIELTALDEKPGTVMKELTNVQALELAELVYEMNFASVLKNSKSLFEKIGSLFLSGRPLPPSASDTDTPSPTVTEETSKKEGLPESK